MPHTSSLSSLRLHNSRVIGNSEFNQASTSPTQSFASSVSTDDPSATTAASSLTRSETAQLYFPLEEKTSKTTTCTTCAATSAEPVLSRCVNEESAQSTGGGTDNNKGTDGNPSLTGTDQRARCNASPTLSNAESEMSLRLRENVAKRTKEVGVSSRDCEHSSSKKATPKSRHKTGSRSFLLKFKRLTLLALIYIDWFFCNIYYIVRKGLEPITRFSTLTVVKEQERRVPLSNALFSLGTEVSKKHCPELWVCSEDIQLSLLVVVGGASERFIWKELKEVVYAEENWARALYHLRRTLWPNGQLMKRSRVKLDEMERTKVKEKAAEAIRMFLPGKKNVRGHFISKAVVKDYCIVGNIGKVFNLANFQIVTKLKIH